MSRQRLAKLTPGTRPSGSGPLPLIHASLLPDTVRGRTVFSEKVLALNSGPCCFFQLLDPCANGLCLPETRCHTRGADGIHRPLGWRPKPSGCVYVRQHLREGFLALGETGADWASSVKLFHGAEVLAPRNVLLGVKAASLFSGLSVACGATGWS